MYREQPQQQHRNAAGIGNFFSSLQNVVGKEGLKTKVTVSIASEEYVKLGATIVGAIWIAYLGTTLLGFVFKKK